MLSDSLAPPVVEPLLTGRFGRPYLYREVCTSTQTLLGADRPEGAAAVCEEQTGGRGRRGRAWLAPARSSILCSVLLRPPGGRRLPELSLVGGVAAASVVETMLGVPAGIKWPNDVLVDGAKVAGILAEAHDGAVVLGIGLNVNQTRGQLPGGLSPPAASLRTVDGRERERGPILARLLAELERRYGRWLDAGFEGVRAELASRDVLQGRPVRIDGVAGVAVGIGAEGRLLVEVAGVRRAFESGEVRWED